MRPIRWRLLIVSLAVAYGTAFLGSIFTRTDSWYESVKPSITPPNYVFPVVWSVLYLLIAISFYLTWEQAGPERRPVVGGLFGINLLLNLAWTPLFFGLHRPVAAFFDLAALVASTIALIVVLWRIRMAASLLLVPYALWLGFAGVLNYLIAFR